ncbi:MAG TPA: M23 family metallopeptidase [Gemmatimonadaceae bacterium]|nr:M23 family metallopeptidase [Gemmatimonadaceae bacterium]
MRRVLPLILFAVGAAACAPRVGTTVVPLPAAPESPGIPLADGPEGESPSPTAGGPGSSPARRPALATAVMVPSARIAAAIERLREKELVIPVAGVEPWRIEDSFAAARDGGERVHGAVDILAPRNTPVLAADDGTVLRLSTNALGGITVYAADPRQQFVYYYAHLDRYHPELVTGRAIRKGDTLGYVGTTGNAPKNVPHLHFQIMLWPSDGKWWNGEPVNPFPVLRQAGPSGATRLRFD